ncbi:class I SAM-dependent methyltransferase [Gammaproteobacteria bacterium]|nr:class I SAM-dependent methyltransferase [Gammaproteobacteria bacterium]
MNPVSATRKFCAMAALLAKDPSGLRYVHRWFYSLLPGHYPLVDELPWITFKAITWLSDYLDPDMTVFEYGSGGSTLFLCQRVQRVITVEHDRAYFDLVRDRLATRGITNCEYMLREPAPLCSPEIQDYSTESFTSFAERYRKMSFREYVRTIDNYPDQTFDLVVVDGRSRISCVRRALKKIKPGGYILLDNSERPGYQDARNLLKHCDSCDFFGIVPSNLELYQTSVWRID